MNDEMLIRVEPQCDHGVVFDEDEARKLLDGWEPDEVIDFVMGNPMASEIRKRWPRLDGICPKGCGYIGIAYASENHYTCGDW